MHTHVSFWMCIRLKTHMCLKTCMHPTVVLCARPYLTASKEKRRGKEGERVWLNPCIQSVQFAILKMQWTIKHIQDAGGD